MGQRVMGMESNANDAVRTFYAQWGTPASYGSDLDEECLKRAPQSLSCTTTRMTAPDRSHLLTQPVDSSFGDNRP